jgi:uncharacterized repeat protein (TIGR01451 family)
MNPVRLIARESWVPRLTYGVLAALLVLGAVQAVGASTPPTGNVTVPSTPGTVTDSPTADPHVSNVTVPAGVYTNVDAVFEFKISWVDAGNDEILTVLKPDGSVLASSDGGDPSETVTASNLPGGAYRVVACAFTGPTSQDYTGTLTITTTAVAPVGPPGPNRGITFDHAIWNDPIRMVGEPDIVIDNKDGIYASGPGGSTTQSSWFWKSTDHGIQWHLVGCPGKSNCQNGGGDTEIVIGNNRDLFASDLQTLQCNSTFRSMDEGATFTPGEGCFPETDRQWMGIYDPTSSAQDRRIYLAANGTVQGCYLLVSTDNGVTYQPPDPANPTAAIDPVGGAGCIGRMAVDPANGEIFVPGGGGNTWVSTDGGVTFQKRGTSHAQGNFFSSIMMDTAGNLWQAWTEGTATYLSYSKDRGTTWHDKIQVSTGPASPIGTNPGIRQVLFPWMAVGDPGRVAIGFYGTDDAGDTGGFPGSPHAFWHTYVTFSTDAMSATPTFTQVQADEHPMHRGAICTGGFPGCLINNSDRSMADFFMLDKDSDGRVYIAFNENSDLSRVAVDPNTGSEEFIGKPIDMILRLRTGPSLFAAKGNLLPYPRPEDVTIDSAALTGNSLAVSGTQGLPPGNFVTDPANDAPFPVVPVSSANHPALDILHVGASDDGTNLTFTLDMTDLSPPALGDAAAAGGAPGWLVTWWQTRGGIADTALMAPPYYSHYYMKWRGGDVYEFGQVSSIDAPALGAPTPKYLTYVPMGTATGSVNGNRVTMTVPLAALGGLTAGDKLDHIGAFSLAEHADATLNDWVDQAKTFSYVIGSPAAAQHQPDGYVEVSLNSNFNPSTRATVNPLTGVWTAALGSVPPTGLVYARQVLAKDLYTPLWDDVPAGPDASFDYGATTRADLSLTKTAAPEPVVSGTTLTYTLTVSNAGPNTAQTARITDPLPPGVTYVDGTTSQGAGCTGTSGTVRCALGAIGSGNTATATIRVIPNGTAQITNTASTASATIDPSMGNNTASATSSLGAPIRADLSIDKADSRDPAAKGRGLDYTLTVTNHGPDTATNVTVSDPLPSELVFRSADASQGTCSESSGTVTCGLSDLAKDAQATVTIHVRPQSTGNVDNTASVSSGVQDPDGSNNSDTERTKVLKPTCPGKLAGLVGNHIIGTNGPDVLKGTRGRDIICGLGGSDELRGFGGDDVIVGGDGPDFIVGGPGNDRLQGNLGNDLIHGGQGNDRIAGWRGVDREFGGIGNDRLNSGPGRDRLTGGLGSDTLISGKNDDVLLARDGIKGNDSLNGQAGHDRCEADRGDKLRNC